MIALVVWAASDEQLASKKVRSVVRGDYGQSYSTKLLALTLDEVKPH